ncbi:MAG: hypothetical protein P4L03_06380 [Terracidiphilus sp.]|nr:hypothetical protein [Terracidiphilus sp.]
MGDTDRAAVAGAGGDAVETSFLSSEFLSGAGGLSEPVADGVGREAHLEDAIPIIKAWDVYGAMSEGKAGAEGDIGEGISGLRATERELKNAPLFDGSGGGFGLWRGWQPDRQQRRQRQA